MPCKSGCMEGKEENSPGVCPGSLCNPKKESLALKPCPKLSKCPKRKSMEEIKKQSENALPKSHHSMTKVLK